MSQLPDPNQQAAQPQLRPAMPLPGAPTMATSPQWQTAPSPAQQDAAAMQAQLDAAAQANAPAGAQVSTPAAGIMQLPATTQQPVTGITLAADYGMGAAEVPQWLQTVGAADSGLENLQQYLVPSVLRLRQPLTDNPEVMRYTKGGDIYLSPQLQVLHEQDGAPILFTPILQFTEFLCINPRGIKPGIRERSADPNSETARRCRDVQIRNSVPCPEAANRPANEDRNVHYVESMNFLIMLRIPNAPVLPVLLSFRNTGFFQGKKFSTLIMARAGANGVAPVYSGVYAIKSVVQTNEKGTFYNWEVSNAGWVPSEAEFNAYKKMYIDMRKAYESGEIRTDDDDDSDVGGAGVPAGQQQPQQGGAPQGYAYTQEAAQPRQTVAQGNGTGSLDPNAMLNQAAQQTRQSAGF